MPLIPAGRNLRQENLDFKSLSQSELYSENLSWGRGAANLLPPLLPTLKQPLNDFLHLLIVGGDPSEPWRAHRRGDNLQGSGSLPPCTSGIELVFSGLGTSAFTQWPIVWLLSA